MIDETNNNEWRDQPATEPTSAQTSSTNANPNPESMGFCQDCGRPLTRETIRTVGNGVFCEPCLEIRLGAVPPPPPPVGAIPSPTGTPWGQSPSTAGWLSVIPGVGTMYNGQYAKAIAIIVIFAVLQWMTDHITGAFGILLMAWWIYQIFDAVHTARAQRDGLPLPNPFGLNEVAERMGYGRTWGTHVPPAAQLGTTASAGWSAAPQPDASVPPPPAATAWAPVPSVPPVPPVNPAHHANWAGYIPPVAFGQAPATSSYHAPNHVPPAAPYAPSYEPVAYAVPPVPVDPNAARRFPAAAVWLIGLGCVFLLVEYVPGLHFNGNWVTAGVLAIITAASLYKQMGAVQRMRDAGIEGAGVYFHQFRFALVTATFAVLFALQAMDIATIGQTWPVILIVFGVVAIADRSLPQPPPYVPPAPVAAVPLETATTNEEATR
jgi:hypothetical protein